MRIENYTVQDADTLVILPQWESWKQPNSRAGRTSDMNVKNRKMIAAIALTFAAGILMIRADTHYVSLNGTNNSPYLNWPDAATNIQWAVDAASAATFDTVLVSNGTYILTNTITIAKAITLRSVNGRDYTQMQMDLTWGSNRCISLTTTGTIDGFTIANGCMTNTTEGGGIRMTAGTIQNCTVVSNHLTATANGTYGGGIYCSGGYVYNCLVTSNSSGYSGGGVYLNSAVMGSNCVISGNCATNTGGVWADGYSRITDCVVSNNINTGVGKQSSGMNFGDSAHCYASNCVITDNLGLANAFRINGTSTAEYCIVRNNILVNQQGACLLYGTLKNSVIHDNNIQSYDYRCTGLKVVGGGIAENCVISNNLGGNYGSGVRLSGSGTLRNCLVISNTGGNYGGGIYCDGAGTVDCCTVVSNYSLRGGGIYFAIADTTNVVINTIAFGNIAGEPTSNIYETAGSVNLFTNCNVGATVSGANNINTNPAWVDPANRNFRLRANSPCVNTGTNQVSWMTGAFDLDGRIRIRYGTVDMGAYEFIRSGTIFSFH